MKISDEAIERSVCVCEREGREVGGQRTLFSSSVGGCGRSQVARLTLITADGSLVFYLHVKGNAHIV